MKKLITLGTALFASASLSFGAFYENPLTTTNLAGVLAFLNNWASTSAVSPNQITGTFTNLSVNGIAVLTNANAFDGIGVSTNIATQYSLAVSNFFATNGFVTVNNPFALGNNYANNYARPAQATVMYEYAVNTNNGFALMFSNYSSGEVRYYGSPALANTTNGIILTQTNELTFTMAPGDTIVLTGANVALPRSSIKYRP